MIATEGNFTRNSDLPVPSRSEIILYLTQFDEPVSFEMLCRDFGVERVNSRAGYEITDRIRTVEDLGILDYDPMGRFRLSGRLDFFTGVVIGHPRGHGFLEPEEGGETIFLDRFQMRTALHGDKVLVKRTDQIQQGHPKGEIIEVMSSPDREIVGRFRRAEFGFGEVIPTDKRFSRIIRISMNTFGNARFGDIVVVRITDHTQDFHQLNGSIIRVLDRESTAGTDGEFILGMYGISSSWPEEVEGQVEEERSDMAEVSMDESRTDLRELPLVTVDGEDARDFDDAVFCDRIPEGWRLVVAIADVSHYVRVNSPLDLEALNRGNSVYFPTRVVPMLPEALSNGICSLNPGEDRYCMVCDMQISDEGNILDYQFYPGVMRSKARLTYEVLESILSGQDAEIRKMWSHVLEPLDNLNGVFQSLEAQRSKRGTIDLDFPEPKFHFDEDGQVQHVSEQIRTVAHRIIEASMLAANCCAAELLQEHCSENGMFRNHDGPEPQNLESLRAFLRENGLYLAGDEAPRAADYAAVLKDAALRSATLVSVQTALLRSLGQAEYASKSRGHFALSFPAYTHFTSPIRRYPDLIVHRMIRNIISGGQDKVIPTGKSLAEVGAHCSFTERRADDAARDVHSLLKAKIAEKHIDEIHHGVTTGVRNFGVFVQLEDIHIDGMIHISALGNDYFIYDSIKQSLTGRNGGRQFKLGTRVRVRINSVHRESSRVEFTLEESGRTLKRGLYNRRSRNRGRRRG